MTNTEYHKAPFSLLVEFIGNIISQKKYDVLFCLDGIASRFKRYDRLNPDRLNDPSAIVQILLDNGYSEDNNDLNFICATIRAFYHAIEMRYIDSADDMTISLDVSVDDDLIPAPAYRATISVLRKNPLEPAMRVVSSSYVVCDMDYRLALASVIEKFAAAVASCVTVDMFNKM